MRRIDYIFIACIVLIIAIGPLVLISNSPSIYYYSSELNAENRLDDSYEEMSSVVGFLFDDEELSDSFTENEKSHMEDVRFLLNIGTIFIGFLSLIIGIYFLYLYYKNKSFDYRTLTISGYISLVFIGFILISVLLDFQWTFQVFHEVFFPQGNWQFPVDSLLITLFPREFFIQMSYTYIVSTIVLSSILIAKGLFCNHKSTGKPN